MSEQPEQPRQPQSYSEKEEKQEKEEEKQYEKQEKEEKSWEEKWRRDPLGVIVWAVILIWAGLVLLAENLGMLGDLADLARRQEWPVETMGSWPIIFIGAGVIVLLEVVVRLIMPAYRRPIGGSLVFAAILLGIGLGGIFGWEVIGPLVLVAIGLSILLSNVMRRRR